MFLILSFLVVGGVAMAVDAIGLWIVIGLPLVGLIALVSCVNEHLGINAMLYHSWQFLSGYSAPGAITQCTSPHGNDILGLVADLVLLVVMLGVAVLGTATVFALPVGLVWAAGGSLAAMAKRDAEAAQSGFMVLAGGIGGVVVVGLALRLVGAVYHATC